MAEMNALPRVGGSGGQALLQGLDCEQREAVSAPPGPLLVIAGAGSGKTRVLTRRAAWAVREWGLEPGSVVCVTFTNRAREEMEARLRVLVGPRASEVVVGTFHAISHHMLRARGNAARVGRTPGFAIADAADQRRLAAEAIRRAGRRCAGFTPRETLAAISFAKARLVTPSRLAQSSPPVAEVWAHYRALCRELDVLDFEDLIAAASRLLESEPEAREHYRAAWRCVLVDEFQDTSPAQLRWLELVSGGERNVSAVGDLSQAVYGFRGADLGIVERFERGFGARVVVLRNNYRSLGRVVSLARSVLDSAGECHNEPRAARGEGGEVAIEGFPSEASEARAVAARCSEWLAAGVAAREIAVLVRARWPLLSLIEAELGAAGVAYRVLGDTSLFAREEVRTALAFLRLAAHPSDRLAAERAARAIAGLGPRTIALCAAFAAAEGITLSQALARAAEAPGVRPRQAGAAASLAAVVARVREAASRDLGEALEAAIRGSGLRERLRRQDGEEAAVRLRSLVRLEQTARRFAAQRPDADPGEFCSEVALSGEECAEGRERVTVATVHAAKGGEWDAVALAGACEGLLPARRALAEGHVAEEARIAYVALTRARERLWVTHAETLDGRPTRRSRLLQRAA